MSNDQQQSLLERIAEVVQVNANSKQVYGEPVERNGATIIPVAKIQWGFGGGGIGHGAAERGGGGGGVRAQPAGFIIVKDGEAEFRPYHDARDFALLAGVALAGIVTGLIIGRRS
jgi:uncharacterized spore protein YtfJ